MARNEDYNWLDDPFNDKKALSEQAKAATSGGSKIALGCGCLLVLVILVVLAIFVGISMLDVLSQ